MELNITQLIERLQLCDECQRIEAKESKTNLGSSVIETISAFSNEPDLGGGFIICGLKKNENSCSSRYSIIGVDNPDKIQCELATICRETFNIQIRPKIIVGTQNDKVLVAAFIAESFCRDKPVFIKKLGEEKGTFRRVGSSDHRCTADDLDLLYQLRRQRSYELEIFPDTNWEDVSQEAITDYRRLRIQIDPIASELNLDDKHLLISLGVAIKKDNAVFPTIGGLLLFGTKAALRRTMPIAARIDYILVDGSEWVQNPLERYHSIEYREALITVMWRLHAQILNDLPTRFHLETGQLQRSDVPCIPKNVIREALANVLMHRDYRVSQPVQIIRYSNRIEFHNPGYSLKPFDELGQPGSLTRNGKIAAVFHDLKFAETKGTGITTMRRLMDETGLSTPPLIETDRDGNKFNLLLLPHHLLDEANLKWLSKFKGLKLSEPDMRALVLAKEVGAITNQDYRQINGTHILQASAALRHLRDQGLLTMKGSGNGTFYTPIPQLLENEETNPSKQKNEGLTPYISNFKDALTPYANPLYKGLEAIPKGFPDLSDDLKNDIINIKKRCPKDEIKKIIQNLCALGALQPFQLANILNKDAQYLRINFLSEMVKAGELGYLHPKQPAHPQQAYKSLKQIYQKEELGVTK